MSKSGAAEAYRRDDNSSVLETAMSTIERMPPEERRLKYRECATFLLIRHLIEKGLAEGPLDKEECSPSVDECVAENADGICFLFDVRDRVWDVSLYRKEASRIAIKEDPSRLKDPALFVMDLGRPAKIKPRNLRLSE